MFLGAGNSWLVRGIRCAGPRLTLLTSGERGPSPERTKILELIKLSATLGEFGRSSRPWHMWRALSLSLEFLVVKPFFVLLESSGLGPSTSSLEQPSAAVVDELRS